MNEDIDLEKYLKNNGWSCSRSNLNCTKILSPDYFEAISIGDIGGYMWYVWDKKYDNKNPIDYKFFSYPENLLKFLKERNND